MRFVELLVTDCLEEPVSVRTEWIHRDHIESVEAWGDHDEDGPLWLELILTSGRVRYVPIGRAGHGDDVAVVAGRAVRVLLEAGQDPIAATW